jgi:cytochrome P450
MFRTASEDYTIAKGTERETLISKGTTIMPLMHSAMFDPAAFDDPDTFNPARPYGNSFHFGFGSHECMGKEIGRVMIPEMVRQLLLRPEVQAKGSIDRKGGAVPEHYSIQWQA